ncbi:hypothetical protein ASG17_04670 [Brevundimonas sp. Leaf363]|uniref:DUF1800 domain-containing protein n=1 Tax=Brevundimonas sp. Leaf363 TaxID=1736353 RepID=UPI0006F251F5|nr:DUF1800 domain-containing protein [Brevundimonas sp. Leaf363]KQS55383.1 hypothetical protein ASG17_04670 [Brevundimonas sp. Leaf363]
MERPGKPTRAEAARFLLRAQFSADEADLQALTAEGYDAWLEAQFAKPAYMTGAQWLDARGHNAVTAEARYFWPMAGDHMIWNQLLAAPDQFRQRAAFALSQFFVVSLNPIDGFWPPYMMAGYWHVLTRNAFGDFRTLLEEITLNPAMGKYLNTQGNLKEDPATGRQPDENYAREILQLFSIGLYELNPDGTEKLNAAGQPIETYVQADISNLCRVFTGYDHDLSHTSKTNVSWQDYPVLGTRFCSDPMKLDPGKHSNLEVNFLGRTIPAGTPGPDALKIALDHIAAHPNVGPFFGKQMIQRLVTSNPSPAYVARIAAAFDDNGQGKRGDLKAVWRAVLTDPEALKPVDATDPLAGRLREPVARMVSWARTAGVASESGAYEVYDLSRSDEGLGQSPLRSPSVFNFYRPGYVPPHTGISEAARLAPEFQLQNETSIAGYINFMRDAVRWGVNDVKPTYAEMTPLAHDVPALIDFLNLKLAANQLSEPTLELIRTALASKGVTADSSVPAKRDVLASACLLVLASPEYLVQK